MIGNSARHLITDVEANQLIRTSVRCRICGDVSAPFERGRVLGKYDVQYWRCPHCGSIQTDTAFWLDEAYSEAITSSDLGLIGRNLWAARVLQDMVLPHFDPDARFVDYGGGYGILVRLMRDAGYDFHLYDSHCANLFAKSFEAAEPKGQYELLTAFEVFEHLANPSTEIAQILEYSKNILFSTLLLPAQPPPLDQWWYYGLEHGQHVTFYSLQSLRVLAKKFGLTLYSDGFQLHLFTQKQLPKNPLKTVNANRLSRLQARLRRQRLITRPSLLADDYFKVTGRRLA